MQFRSSGIGEAYFDSACKQRREEALGTRHHVVWLGGHPMAPGHGGQRSCPPQNNTQYAAARSRAMKRPVRFLGAAHRRRYGIVTDGGDVLFFGNTTENDCQRGERNVLFSSLMKFAVKTGAMRLIDSTGREHVFGDGSPPSCTMRMKKASLDYTLQLNPALYVPEAYMNGDVVIEDGTLYDFIELAARNYSNIENSPLANALRWIGVGSRKVRQYNPVGTAQKNVAHHYDLSDGLYDLFLDRDRQYSCAYFISPDDDIRNRAGQQETAPRLQDAARSRRA